MRRLGDPSSNTRFLVSIANSAVMSGCDQSQRTERQED